MLEERYLNFYLEFPIVCAYPKVHNDLHTLKVQKKQLPGKDQVSKMILKSSKVIDLITSDLLGVSEGNYTVASTEWQDGTYSDILYVPRLGIQKSLPPILKEIYLIINEAFIQGLVQYGQSVYNHLQNAYCSETSLKDYVSAELAVPQTI